MSIEDKITIDERGKYLRKMQERYVHADCKERGQLPDEMETVTELHRKSLIRLMKGSLALQTCSLRFPDVLLTFVWYTMCGWRKGEDMDTHPQGGQEQRDYLSYLLRLWRESDEGRPVWRASLKSSRTGEKVGFGSLEALFEFLRRQTGIMPNAVRSEQEP